MVGLLAGAAKGLMKKPQKINPDKFAGKMEETKADSKPKGGALALAPSESIVKVVDIKPKEPKVKAKGGPLAEIQETVHSIVVALKGEEDTKKKRIQQKNKKNQKKKRLNLEALSELGKTTSKVAGGIASATGMTSLWNAIWKTVGLLFAGWLTNFIPQIVGFVTKFIDITKKVIDVAKPIVGFIWDSLVWITDKGVKLLAMVSGIKPDEASENSIIKNLTEIQKKLPLIEAAFGFFALLKLKSSFGGGQPRGGKPKPKPKPKPKWRKTLEQKFKKSNIGQKARNQLAKFRKLQRNLKPQRISNWVKQGGPDKVIKNTVKRIQNVKPLQTIQNLTKKINLNPFKGMNLGQKAGNLWKGAKELGKKALTGLDDFAKKQMGNVDNIIGGIKARGAKWAQKIGGALDKMNPMKLGEKVKGLLKNQIDDILKKNDFIKQLKKLKNLNPKDAAKNIKKLLEGAKRNKNILKLRQGLKAAKAAKIGGVDAVIAAIMGVLDYAVFKESPINAVLRAIGGLLGYTAGFAIGAPFGGAPGFITGMAGAFVGEWASKKIAQGLAKTKLGSIPDPIMKDGRMLVRDPDDAEMNTELEQAQSAHGLGDDSKFEKMSKVFIQGDKTYDLSLPMGGLSREEYEALDERDRKQLDRRLRAYRSQNPDLTTTKTKSKDADLISQSASYDDKAGKSTIIPVPIDDMKGAGNATVKTTVTSSDGVNKYDAVAESKKTMVLSKMYS